MLTNSEYVRLSLELHLFFSRIMKEHVLFLKIRLTPRDSNFSQMADDLRRGFDNILADAISLSDGVVSPVVLDSGEVATRYTLDAEKATEFFTGVKIPTSLTVKEQNLRGSDRSSNITGTMVDRVFDLNSKVMDLLKKIINFKSRILSDVLSCRMFTVNYPLLIEHILREARFYLQLVQRLQNRDDTDLMSEALEQEEFWNRIMAEHSLFIRGLLDPTEHDLIVLANNFGNEFAQLTEESIRAMDNTMLLSQVTNESLTATRELRDFKAQGTEGILACKVRSIIIPLLGDHTLREANHFLRLLESYRRI